MYALTHVPLQISFKKSLCESLPHKWTLGKYCHWLCSSEIIRPPKIFGQNVQIRMLKTVSSIPDLSLKKWPHF